MPLAAENGTFGDPVRRPSEAVESLTDGLGGPSYKCAGGSRHRYNCRSNYEPASTSFFNLSLNTLRTLSTLGLATALQ